MNECDVPGDAGQFQYPVERRIAAAENDQFLTCKLLRIPDAVMQCLVRVVLDVRYSERPRLE
jgi:hypothetical protein